jgi:hypothetical protein
MSLYVANKTFRMLGQRRFNHISCFTARSVRVRVPQFLNQGFHAGNMFVTGPAPGDILQQKQNILGNPSAFWVLQASGIYDFIQSDDGIIDRASIIEHIFLTFFQPVRVAPVISCQVLDEAVQTADG